MKVLFLTSIEDLIERVGSRFRNRFRRLCECYRSRHKYLPESYVKFAVSVGWSLFAAAQGGDFAYATELTSGLEGNPEAIVNTGLSEMHLVMEDCEDFEVVKELSYDTAMLLLQELEATREIQVFFDYMERYSCHALDPSVMGDEEGGSCTDDCASECHRTQTETSAHEVPHVERYTGQHITVINFVNCKFFSDEATAIDRVETYFNH